VFSLERADFQNVQSRLQGFIHLLYVRARRDELHIVAVFVYVIAEHLLTLLVDAVNVVYYNEFTLAPDIGLRLAKRLHLVAKKLDSLFLQIVDKHDVVFGEYCLFVETVIVANDGVHQRGFAGALGADDD
jgi:hypothetical protein